MVIRQLLHLIPRQKQNKVFALVVLFKCHMTKYIIILVHIQLQFYHSINWLCELGHEISPEFFFSCQHSQMQTNFLTNLLLLKLNILYLLLECKYASNLLLRSKSKIFENQRLPENKNFCRVTSLDFVALEIAAT